MSLDILYRNMLVSTDENALSVAMQERIYRHCTARKDNALLVTLAKYPHLDAGIDACIKGHDDLNVIVAWATRPNRTSVELAERLLSDKRVAVLKPLAALPDLPAEVYQTIAKVTSANLAEILAGNPSVPLPIRLKKIREHVKRIPRGAGHRHDERIHALCVDPKGPNGEIGVANHAQPMYEAIAETTLVPPYIVACLSKQYIRATDLDRWVENFDAIAANAGSDWRGQLATIITMIASHNIDDARQTRLVEKVQAYINRNGTGYRTSQVQSALAKIVSQDSELEQMFRDLVETTDPAKAGELVSTIRTRAKSNEDLVRLAGMVARHPHVPVKHGVALLPLMQRGQHDDRTFFSRLEAMQDYETILEIIEIGNPYGYQPAIIYALSDSRKVMEAMIERYRENGKLLPGWTTSLEPIRGNAELALEMLPWMKISESLHEIPGLAHLIETRIFAGLAGDDLKWEAFNGLADGFAGNLEDLLGAATALSA
jgi:hypothetical protein